MLKKFILLTTLFYSLGCSTIQAADILDGQWQLTDISSTQVKNKNAVIRFNAHEHSFSINAGCNTLLGDYVLKDKGITFSSPMTTLMACPENIRLLENTLADLLSSVTKYEIKQNTLKLYNSNNALILQAIK